MTWIVMWLVTFVSGPVVPMGSPAFSVPRHDVQLESPSFAVPKIKVPRGVRGL